MPVSGLTVSGAEIGPPVEPIYVLDSSVSQRFRRSGPGRPGRRILNGRALRVDFERRRRRCAVLAHRRWDWAEGDIPSVLRPFSRVESAFSRSHEGSGLGLPLAKSFIEAQWPHLAAQPAA